MELFIHGISFVWQPFQLDSFEENGRKSSNPITINELHEIGSGTQVFRYRQHDLVVVYSTAADLANHYSLHTNQSSLLSIQMPIKTCLYFIKKLC